MKIIFYLNVPRSYSTISFRKYGCETLHHRERVPRASERVPGGPVHGLHVHERHGGVHAAHMPGADVRCARAAASAREVLSGVPAGGGGESCVHHRREGLSGLYLLIRTFFNK